MMFLREWASDPIRVAAITPSSSRLAKLITKEIDADVGPVIELGPGTGVFTRALIGRGVPECDLVLVELSKRFAEDLTQLFPTAQVLNISAEQLSQHMVFGKHGAGAVVSGLGLLPMPTPVIDGILKGVLDNLKPDGCMYQFTYGWRCPVPEQLLRKYDLVAERIGIVPANFPPASVYKVTRRKAGHPVMAEVNRRNGKRRLRSRIFRKRAGVAP